MIKKKNSTGLKNKEIENYLNNFIEQQIKQPFKVSYKPFEEDLINDPLYIKDKKTTNKYLLKYNREQELEKNKQLIIKEDTKEIKQNYKKNYIKLFGDTKEEQRENVIETMIECVRFNSIKLYAYKSSIEDNEYTELVDLDKLKLLLNEKNINNKEIFKSYEMIVDFTTKEKATNDFVRN